MKLSLKENLGEQGSWWRRNKKAALSQTASHGSDGTYSSPLATVWMGVTERQLSNGGVDSGYRAPVLINMNHLKELREASRARPRGGEEAKKAAKRQKRKLRKRDETHQNKTMTTSAGIAFIRPPEPISDPPYPVIHSRPFAPKYNA